MKHSIKIVSEIQRAYAIEMIRLIPLEILHTVEIKERKTSRSLIQNDKMWATLTDISQQVDWHGQKLPPEVWKDIFTASLRKQRVVPGLDGNFVVCGQSTSKMSIKEMSDVIELATAFGMQYGVHFHDPQYDNE